MLSPSRVCALILALSCVAGSARAQDVSSEVSDALKLHFSSDWTRQNRVVAEGEFESDVTLKPALSATLHDRWTVTGLAVMKSGTQWSRFDIARTEDHSLSLQDARLDYASGRMGVRAGTLEPAFGIAWARTPGMYGAEFAKGGYKSPRRIGIHGNRELGGGDAGNHIMSAESYFVDTTVLENWTMHGRKGGGIGDKEGFRSFLVKLDGNGIPGLAGFKYHAAVLREGRKPDQETGALSVAISGDSRFDLIHGVSLSPLVEYVHQDNPDGKADRTREFLTVAGRLDWRDANLALAWTDRDTQIDNARDDKDFQFQVSAGYAFDFGLKLDVGWKIVDENRDKTRTLGVKAAYSLRF